MGNSRLHSDAWPRIQQNRLPAAVADAVEVIAGAGGVTEIAGYATRLSDDWPVALLTLQADLPSRGPVRGLDIRAEEPVIVAFPPAFPHKCPHVFPDRCDFPVQHLPHLYAAPPQEPSRLCLGRGSADDWYVENGMDEFIQTARRWLADAAVDRLIPPDDDFEPIRIPSDVQCGISLLSAVRVTGICGGRGISRRDGRDWVYAACRIGQLALGPRSSWLVRLGDEITEETARCLAALRPRQGGTNSVPAVVAWTNAIMREYSARLPQTLDQLIEWLATDFGVVHPERIMQRVRPTDLPLPIFIVVRRPQQVIGNHTYEDTLTFLSMGAAPDSSVMPLLGYAPYEVATARRMSAIPAAPLDRIALIGAGAVGSKVIMHLARSGHTNLVVVDPDIMLPHNTARHALLPASVWSGKALAVRDAINQMYVSSARAGVTAVPRDVAAAYQVAEFPANATAVVDCSASAAVSDFLSTLQNELPKRASCFMVDRGRIGAALIEGDYHNPSIDDLEVQMWDAAIDHSAVSEWLMRRRDRQFSGEDPDLDELGLGAGCSTLTMPCADDTVSVHSALMSLCIRQYGLGARECGIIQLSVVDPEAGADTLHYEIQPVIVLGNQMHETWEVRLAGAAQTAMRALSHDKSPAETGGILLGHVDVRRRRLYVTRAEPAPPDSQERPYSFRRGITDVPQRVSTVRELSGGLLDYVGEWHTHPEQPALASVTDERTLAEIHTSLRRTGRPAFILILGHDGYRAYLR